MDRAETNARLVGSALEDRRSLRMVTPVFVPRAKRDGIPRSAKRPRSEAEWDSGDLRLGGVANG
jgi:hypothetical protein